MEYTRIPGIEQDVARIGLGTWAIGGWMWGGTDEAQSVRTIHTALDKGLNLIDTAPVYGFGTSEEIVGRTVEDYGGRENVIIATKCGLEWRREGGKTKIRRNSSRARLEHEVQESLRRLRTDYIDIYQVHWPDHDVPFEETAEALVEMKEKRLIRTIGVSNYSPEQMDEFRRSAPLAVVQPPYNLFERGIEDDVLPYARDTGLTTLTYGALCRGLLTGKIEPGQEFSGDDLRKSDPKFEEPRCSQYVDAAQKLDAFAREAYGKRIIHLAIRWLLDHGADVPLWGSRRPDQLEPIEDVWGWSLDEDAMAQIDGILEETIDRPVGPEFMAPPR